MITPELERLILQRKAVFKTHNHGVSGVGTIPNPNNRTIIVTGFIYQPFVDYPDNISAADLKIFQEGKFIHTLRLSAKENNANWTFRDTFKTNQISSTAYMILPEKPIQVDTFFVANENINIDIFGFNTVQDWDTSSQVFCPVDSDEEILPSGYGKITDAVGERAQNIQSFDTAQSGNIQTIVPLGPRAKAYSQIPNVKFDFTGDVPLIMPTFNVDKFAIDYVCFPIVTFQYVELLEKYTVGNIMNR